MSTTTTPTNSQPTATGTPARYLEPGWMTQHIANAIMAALTRAGVSVKGSRVLHVRGRRTGEWHTVPVNPLTVDGHQYLVAPRGETQWVRNLRAAGAGRLQLGRSTTAFLATEVHGADVKAPLLQAYLRAWRSEVGAFFDGVDADSLEALRAVASGYPVFVIDTAG